MRYLLLVGLTMMMACGGHVDAGEPCPTPTADAAAADAGEPCAVVVTYGEAITPIAPGGTTAQVIAKACPDGMSPTRGVCEAPPDVVIVESVTAGGAQTCAFRNETGADAEGSLWICCNP